MKRKIILQNLPTQIFDPALVNSSAALTGKELKAKMVKALAAMRVRMDIFRLERSLNEPKMCPLKQKTRNAKIVSFSSICHEFLEKRPKDKIGPTNETISSKIPSHGFSLIRPFWTASEMANELTIFESICTLVVCFRF